MHGACQTNSTSVERVFELFISMVINAACRAQGLCGGAHMRSGAFYMLSAGQSNMSAHFYDAIRVSAQRETPRNTNYTDNLGFNSMPT